MRSFWDNELHDLKRKYDSLKRIKHPTVTSYQERQVAKRAYFEARKTKQETTYGILMYLAIPCFASFPIHLKMRNWMPQMRSHWFEMKLGNQVVGKKYTKQIK